MLKQKVLPGIALCFALGALLFFSSTSSALARTETDDVSHTAIASPAALPLDHYWCYVTTGDSMNETVSLQDQFQPNAVNVTVKAPEFFCNPVRKRHNDKTYNIIDPAAHLTWYKIAAPQGAAHRVRVRNQFGKQRYDVAGTPLWLATPTQVQGQNAPQNLDHFECYRIQNAAPLNQAVDLQDEFAQAVGLVVGKAVLLCNPVRKVHGAQTFEIKNPDAHLVCYQVPRLQVNRQVSIQNQFQQTTLTVKKPKLLCAPSLKTILE